MEIGGTYPMLYAFFDEKLGLRRDAFTRQITAAIASGASGIAVLGLGTEVVKLGREERLQVVDWVMEAVDGELPVCVTINDGNVPDMIKSGQAAHAAGASWVVLQPPNPTITGRQLVQYFGKVAGSLDCPVGIQNAPEYLGAGLSAKELAELNRQHPNVCVVKAESSALAVGDIIDKLSSSMKVFNGRAGLELTDNYRAGVDGMIPGIETVDLQVRVEKAMRAGAEEQAEEIYKTFLPTINFIMQGLPQFLLYGKLIAALRLGIDQSNNRIPSDTINERGLAWAQRYVNQLGPLPG